MMGLVLYDLIIKTSRPSYSAFSPGGASKGFDIFYKFRKVWVYTCLHFFGFTLLHMFYNKVFTLFYRVAMVTLNQG